MWPPLLVIDVGNSRIKFGLFDVAALDSQRLPQPRQWDVVPVDAELPLAEFEHTSGGHHIAAVIAGTNPAAVTRIVTNWPQGLSPPRIVTSIDALPLDVHVNEPPGVGVDRLLNAIAANRIREANQRAIVVGCGTATTVDLVSADGAFEGGAILPGLDMAARSLHEHTALLPLVELDQPGGPWPHIGKNTRDAIRSGVLWGQVGAVKELVAQIGDVTLIRLVSGHPLRPSGQQPVVVLTGGGARLLAPHFPDAAYEQHLTLTGLALAARHLGVA